MFAAAVLSDVLFFLFFLFRFLFLVFDVGPVAQGVDVDGGLVLASAPAVVIGDGLLLLLGLSASQGRTAVEVGRGIVLMKGSKLGFQFHFVCLGVYQAHQFLVLRGRGG